MSFSDFAKESAKRMASGAAGAGAGVGAIAACGVPGLSAAGITSGLAVLGAGSMLAGVGTVALIGFGAYKFTRFAVEHIVDND
jgi:hypothetical protein